MNGRRHALREMQGMGLFLWRPRGAVKTVQLVKGQGFQGLQGPQGHQGSPMYSVFGLHDGHPEPSMCTPYAYEHAPFLCLFFAFPLSGPPFLHMACRTGGEIDALEFGVQITR